MEFMQFIKEYWFLIMFVGTNLYTFLYQNIKTRNDIDNLSNKLSILETNFKKEHEKLEDSMIEKNDKFEKLLSDISSTLKQLELTMREYQVTIKHLQEKIK